MIQIDIPMPKNCGECPICNEYLMCGVPCNGRGWGENNVGDYFTNGRPEWCPLKEQEAIEPDTDSEGTCSCGSCGETVGYYPVGCNNPHKFAMFCPNCGRSVKWE